MDWMSPMDASFLHIEGPMNPMHIGGVSIFEGPAPPFEDLEEMVDRKLGLVPRYRQKVRFIPLGLGRPVWVDDPHFNLSYHLRHSALPPPGTRPAAAADGRADLRPAPRPRQAALGDLDARGIEREPLGAALEGPPLHGRRRLGHRPHVGDVRAGGCAGGGPHLGARPGAERPGAAHAHADPPHAQPVRAASHRARGGTRAARVARPAPRSCSAAWPRARGSCARSAARRWSGRSGRTAPGAGRDVRLSDVKAVRAGARRDGQRRRAHGDRLGRLARSARRARRARRRPHGPHARARLGPRAGRARRLQQPRVGDVRRAAGRDRRPGRAPRVAARADGRPQAVQAGGRGRRAHLALGLRAADAAGDGRPARREVAVAGTADRRHQRARTAAAALHARAGACSSPSRSCR